MQFLFLRNLLINVFQLGDMTKVTYLLGIQRLCSKQLNGELIIHLERLSIIISNLIELYSPTLSWTNQLPFGGYKSLLNVNRRNLKQALSLHTEINIIHAHSVYPGGVIASILSKEFNIPYVITEHMGPRILTLKNGKPIDVIFKSVF